ncbi:hypothetical protein B0J11DRAFT_512247 [Dendryphion nanum]|uniref:Uncharacterized protein n=1 Tax=Dendryphion nanum TaxID=256645 RepID=A0A9P9D264_9PLEO|nr:hypothetical protein B0J11DRAFT_512247 [Dendryphion nanum]
MFFGCGCGFGWPKKGSEELNDLPTLVKSIEDHSPTVGKASLARFFKPKQVYIDRSMSPSPEFMVKSGANWEFEGTREDSLEADWVPEKQAGRSQCSNIRFNLD